MDQPSLFDAPLESADPPDQAIRDFAANPDNDVVLEASAGTGKTRVLANRYLRLLERGVDPRNILAITFTRKAAAEMRDRVLVELRRRASQAAPEARLPTILRDQLADIQIATVDAFCFGLLREFPLEARVEPGFEIADETEMARFAAEAMELTFRIAHGLLPDDERLRLLFVRVTRPVLRTVVQELLDRRHVALPAVGSHVKRLSGSGTSAGVAAAFLAELRAILEASPDRQAIVEEGPNLPEFQRLRDELVRLDSLPPEEAARVQRLRSRLEDHFLTKAGKPRLKLDARRQDFSSQEAFERHGKAVRTLAPLVHALLQRLDADLDGLLARGLLRLLVIAVDRYEHLLEEHGLLDFAGMLAGAVRLLEQQEEFARSRLKLQSRYRHLLVDEFQDTSRLQWRLIELLINTWAEGEGVADAPTSVFVVGDRKQSIYRFRHAEVTLLDEAARKIGAIRPGRQPRRAITTSFRAVPALQAFVNALAGALQRDTPLDERFTYDERDRFPVLAGAADLGRDAEPVVWLSADPTMEACAASVAAEARRLVGTTVVRPADGPPRPARPDDIVVLFRTRAGHQIFERAIEAQGLRTYVYKGLGFFDAPEVQDLQALLRFLAEPDSNLRAAEFLRSRFVRISDVGLARLAPGFADALTAGAAPVVSLDAIDQALLDRTRADVARWLPLADRMTPSELVDLIIRESAYVFEAAGPRLFQARENIKKVRSLLRRVESRGYASLGRLAAYFETLRTGDESNAIVDASGCVQLMTIHAAKGLEFPIVFVVNIHVGGRSRSQVSVIERGVDGESEVAFRSSASTKLEDERDDEESRRLWYVAVTRARDRLYIAGELSEKGQLKRKHRSLASLLPGSFVDVFARVAVARDLGRVVWDSKDGPVTLGVCRTTSGATILADGAESGEDARIDVRPLTVAGRAIAAVTAAEPAPGSGATGEAPLRLDRDGHERLIGTLVHRLLARRLPVGADEAAAARWMTDLVRAEELVDVDDPAAIVARAAALYARLRARADVADVLDAGAWHAEVPFSFAPPDRPDRLVRGVIDGVVIAPDGTATVVEFKTGTPRPEHEVQAGLYADALKAALGAESVQFRLVYP